MEVDQQTIGWLWSRQCAQQSIGIEGEAGRGFPCLRAVSTAAAELAAHRRSKENKTDAALVLETAVLDRIEGQSPALFA